MLDNFGYFDVFSAQASKDTYGAGAAMIADDAMTVRKVAGYLKIKDRTIYWLVANGDMPGFKVEDSW